MAALKTEMIRGGNWKVDFILHHVTTSINDIQVRTRARYFSTWALARAPSMVPWCSRKKGRITLESRYDTSKNCLSKKGALKRKRNPTWSRWHWLHWLQSGPYTRPGRGIWRASRKAPGLHCWTNIKWRSLPSQQWSRQSTRQQRRRRRRPSRWATAYRRSSQSSPGPWWSSRPGRGSPQCWPAAGGLNYCENSLQRKPEEEATWAPNPKASQRTMMPAIP